MSQLLKNSIAFLQKRFPAALVLSHERTYSDEHGAALFKCYPMMTQDMHSGVKQRAIAIENLGSLPEMEVIAQGLKMIFQELEDGTSVEMSNVLKPSGHSINSKQMTFAPRIILYTNKLHTTIAQVVDVFSGAHALIDVVDESEMHKTVFISYGGPDEASASSINTALKARGVKTWFFPDDALPGTKLHRMMHEGVNTHDRVLLVCSKAALIRPGVLNEIEQVLVREAKEAGADILIPISLDDFVYGDWAPARPDIADQVRSRVISKISLTVQAEMEAQIAKVVSALRK
ncbi:MAG: toll/interleukin-1 receptor domain-containing protein [Pseudomonadota bacterium]